MHEPPRKEHLARVSTCNAAGTLDIAAGGHELQAVHHCLLVANAKLHSVTVAIPVVRK